MEIWLEHWHLKENPFSVRPLEFLDPLFYKFFVTNDSVKEFDKYFLTLLTPGHDRSMVILGARGSGKSTLLNYVLRKIVDMKQKKDARAWQVLPIFLNISDINALTTVKSLTDSFLRELLKSMYWAISNDCLNPYRVSFTDLEEKAHDYLSSVAPMNPSACQFLIEEIAHKLKSHFKRSILFIDNIDKAYDSDVVEQWLLQAQGFIDSVLWNNDIYTLFVGGGFWYELLDDRTPAEFSWLYDTHIHMRNWDMNNIRELISNRLKSATTFSESEYALETYISDDALVEIYNTNYAIPRLCLRGTKSSLYHGWENNEKIITSQFIRAHPHCIDGSLEECELSRNQSLYDYIIGNINLRKGYTILNTLFRKEKEHSMSLIDDILSLNKDPGTDGIRNRELLTEYKVIAVSRIKGRTSIDLNKDVKPLMRALYSRLEDYKHVKNFIMREIAI